MCSHIAQKDRLYVLLIGILLRIAIHFDFDTLESVAMATHFA